MGAHDVRVGVRQLRQNLSVYLRRVKEGETLEVTEHGRPVARLAPLPRGDDPLAPYIASGLVIPGTGRLGDLGPPPGRPSAKRSRALQRALDEQRADKI